MYTDEETLWATTLARNPRASIAHNNLGNLLLKSGRVDEAISHYQKVVQLQPDCADAHSSPGAAPAQKQISSRGWSLASSAHYNLGTALRQKGKLDEAVQQFQEAIRLDPAVALPYYGLGMAYALQENLDDAMAMFLQTIKLYPGLAEAHYNLGNAYVRKGKVAEGLAELKATLRLKPDYLEAQEKLADALLKLGKAAEAIPYCEAVVKARPQDAHAHFNLGSACLAAKRLAQATASFKEAVRLAPDTPECLNALAWIYATSPQAQLRNGAEAVRLAERACQLTKRQRDDDTGHTGGGLRGNRPVRGSG